MWSHWRLGLQQMSWGWELGRGDGSVCVISFTGTNSSMLQVKCHTVDMAFTSFLASVYWKLATLGAGSSCTLLSRSPWVSRGDREGWQVPSRWIYVSGKASLRRSCDILADLSVTYPWLQHHCTSCNTMIIIHSYRDRKACLPAPTQTPFLVFLPQAFAL